MRRGLIGLVVVLAAGCQPRVLADVKVNGTIRDQPFSIEIFVSQDFGGLDTEASNDDPGRDVSTNMVTTLTVGNRAKVVGYSELEKADIAAVTVSNLPPSPLWAGEYTKARMTLELWEDKTTSPVGEISLIPTLTFDEVVWTGDGKLKVLLKGRISANWGGTVRGGTMTSTVEGKFQFGADCDSTKYYRLCGQAEYLIPETVGPWRETDCPPEILEPFGEPYGHGDYALTTKGARFTCGRGDHRLLCHASLRDVAADGCVWRVQSIADSHFQSFAVSAWADANCARPQKFCNAWR